MIKKWNVPIEMNVEASVEVNFRATGCNIPGTYDDPPECEDDREVVSAILHIDDTAIDITDMSDLAVGEIVNAAICGAVYAHDINDDIRNWEADNAGAEEDAREAARFDQAMNRRNTT